MGAYYVVRTRAVIASCVSLLTLAGILGAQEGAAGTAVKPAANSPAAEDESGAAEKNEEAREIEAILGSDPSSSLLPLPTAPEAAKSDPEAIKIIERYLEAIGGRKVLEGIEDRSTTFENTKYQATGKAVATMALYLKRGFLYREEWDLADLSIGEHKLAFVQIYNGKLDEGWVQMLNTVSPLEGRTLSVFVWDKYIDDFFMHFEDDGYTAHMAGKGLVDEKPAHIVSVKDFGGRNEVRYFFDAESGLILKKEWIDTATMREGGKKEQYYRRYTRIAFSDSSGRSVLFPLQLEIMVDGILDIDRVYTQVRFNSGLSDELFGKPEGVPFEEREKLTEKIEDVQEKLPIPGAHGIRARSPHPPIRHPHPTPRSSAPAESTSGATNPEASAPEATTSESAEETTSAETSEKN